MQRQPITAADAATMDFSQITGGCTLCRVGGGCGISYKATNPFRELWHNPFWSFASVSLPCPIYHIWEMEFNVLQIEFIARVNDPCDKSKAATAAGSSEYGHNYKLIGDWLPASAVPAGPSHRRRAGWRKNSDCLEFF